MSTTCAGDIVRGPKRGMLPGPVRTASQTIVLVTPCSGGAWIPPASASPAPVIVWQGAQLSANKLNPSATFACEMSRPKGIPGLPNDGANEVTYRTISRTSARSNFAGLRSGSAVGSASGIHPLESHRSTVAPPTPSSGGARSPPEASMPWQVEQFSTNRVRPAASWLAAAGLSWLVRLAALTPVESPLR